MLTVKKHLVFVINLLRRFSIFLPLGIDKCLKKMLFSDVSVIPEKLNAKTSEVYKTSGIYETS